MFAILAFSNDVTTFTSCKPENMNINWYYLYIGSINGGKLWFNAEACIFAAAIIWLKNLKVIGGVPGKIDISHK